MLPQNRPISCRCPAANRCSLGREPGGTSGWIHGLGYLCSAFRREGLISDELSLQLSTFLRSLDLLLELRVRTVPPRSLTPKQPRRGGKQGTDGPELSRFHSSTHHPRDKRQARSWDYCPYLASTISYADLSDKLVNALRSFRGADATAGLVGRRAVDVAT